MAFDMEKFIAYISAATLLAAGVFFIYEGSTYLKMKKSNPSMPNKIYTVASLAIILGSCEIAIGAWHVYYYILRSDTARMTTRI